MCLLTNVKSMAINSHNKQYIKDEPKRKDVLITIWLVYEEFKKKN